MARSRKWKMISAVTPMMAATSMTPQASSQRTERDGNACVMRRARRA